MTELLQPGWPVIMPIGYSRVWLIERNIAMIILMDRVIPDETVGSCTVRTWLRCSRDR